jgi:hypothetical protein
MGMLGTSTTTPYRIQPLSEAEAACFLCRLPDCADTSQACARRIVLAAEQADRRAARGRPLNAADVLARQRRRRLRAEAERQTQEHAS